MKITVEDEWRLPSAERVFEGCLEGPPSPREAAAARAAAEAKRAAWVPGPKAMALLTRLEVEAVGRVVIVQAWDPILYMLSDEGPHPIRATCRAVVTEDTGDGHLQAFLVLEAPESIRSPEGYDGRARFLSRRAGDTLYRFDLGDLYTLEILDP